MVPIAIGMYWLCGTRRGYGVVLKNNAEPIAIGSTPHTHGRAVRQLVPIISGSATKL